MKAHCKTCAGAKRIVGCVLGIMASVFIAEAAIAQIEPSSPAASRDAGHFPPQEDQLPVFDKTPSTVDEDQPWSSALRKALRRREEDIQQTGPGGILPQPVLPPKPQGNPAATLKPDMKSKSLCNREACRVYCPD